jgi:hypothetical protein
MIYFIHFYKIIIYLLWFDLSLKILKYNLLVYILELVY